MSQYNNGNHINNIPVIPDYLDRKDDEPPMVDDSSFVKINKGDEEEEQENQNTDNLVSAKFRLNGSMTTIDENDEEEADGEKEPAGAEEEDEVEEEEEVDNQDVLNTEDSDEVESKSRIYVISVNDIPYYYENNLKEARQQMMNLANHFAATLNDQNGPGHIYVTDHNLKRVKVIAPYSFLMLTYNHVMYEISLEYAVKL
jgi:hypothetical protein